MTLLEPEPEPRQMSERNSEAASENDMAGLMLGQHPPRPARAGLCHSPTAVWEGRTEGHSQQRGLDSS